MARKQDLHDLAAANDVDVNQSDTIPVLETKLAEAGVDVPPEDGAGADSADQADGDGAPELTDDQQAAAHGDAGEAGQAEALGTDKGYSGIKVDPLPNEAYSLESGPASPTAEQSRRISAAQAAGVIEPGEELGLEDVGLERTATDEPNGDEADADQAPAE